MLQRLPIVFVYVKTGKTFQNLLDKWNHTNHIYFISSKRTKLFKIVAEYYFELLTTETMKLPGKH